MLDKYRSKRHNLKTKVRRMILQNFIQIFKVEIKLYGILYVTVRRRMLFGLFYYATSQTRRLRCLHKTVQPSARAFQVPVLGDPILLTPIEYLCTSNK